MESGKGKRGFAALDELISEPDRTSLPLRPVFTGKPLAIWEYAFAGKRWLIACICIAVFFAFSGRSKPPSQTPPASSVGTSQSPTLSPAADNALNPAASEPPISANEERIPPIGKGFAFDRAQIRYCLSEEIRINAWREQMNRSSRNTEGAFNAAVNDYNARCPEFSDRSETIQSIRSEVEAHREALTRQGANSAMRNP
jgi:hypothetical protein